jgi:hypothetical protein
VIKVGQCRVCGEESSYIERTKVKGPYGMGWVDVDRVYAARAYCSRHFFLLREMVKEAEDMLAEHEKVAP